MPVVLHRGEVWCSARAATSPPSARARVFPSLPPRAFAVTAVATIEESRSKLAFCHRPPSPPTPCFVLRVRSFTYPYVLYTDARPAFSININTHLSAFRIARPRDPTQSPHAVTTRPTANEPLEIVSAPHVTSFAGRANYE